MAVSGRSGSAVIDLTDTLHQAKPRARRRAREDSNGDFVDLVGSPRLGSGRAAAAQARAAGGEAAAAAAAGVRLGAAEIDLTEDDDSQNVPSQPRSPAAKRQRAEPRQEQHHQRQQPSQEEQRQRQQPQQAARTDVRPLQQRWQDEQQPQQAQAEQRCDICFDDVQAAFMHKFGACGHSFCLPCLREYITGKITDRTYPVPCPLPDCKQPISAAECGLVLTPEELATLDKMEAEAAVGDGARLFCPNKNCSQLLIADDKRADTAMDCPYCLEPLCANCGVGWHKGLTCQAYQAQPGALRSKEDQALLDLAEQSGLKRCPGCGQMVERTMGCSHITCRCGARFCYSCGKRKEMNSSHFCDCKPHAEQFMVGAPGAAVAVQQQAAVAQQQARALAQQQGGERARQYAQERQAQRAAQRAARQQLQQARQAAQQQLQGDQAAADLLLGQGRQAAQQQLQVAQDFAQQQVQGRRQAAQQQLQAARNLAQQQMQEAQGAAHEQMLRWHAQHQHQQAGQQQQFQQQRQQPGRHRERRHAGGVGGAAAAVAAAAGGPGAAAGAPLLPHAPFALDIPGLARLAEALQQLHQELLLPVM